MCRGRLLENSPVLRRGREPLLHSALRIALELSKIKISAAVALTAVAGGLLWRGRFEWRLLGPAVGVLLAAAGASALNQVLERRVDALMERTRGRPLPSGRATPGAALALALGLVLAGGLTLLATGGSAAMALGLAGVVWYDAVYVFLKRRTAFAVIPGAWVGALPPLIGWTAAGGPAGDPRILALALFLGLWQVPHFWLLLLLHGPDYERAGLPSLTQVCTPRQISLVTSLWLVAAGLLAPFLACFGHARGVPWLLGALIVAGACLIWRAGQLARSELKPEAIRRAFGDLNLFGLVVVVLLCAGRLASGN